MQILKEMLLIVDSFRMICAVLHSLEPDHLQALISFGTKIQKELLVPKQASSH